MREESWKMREESIERREEDKTHVTPASCHSRVKRELNGISTLKNIPLEIPFLALSGSVE